MLSFLLAKAAVLAWGQGWGPWVTHTLLCFLRPLKKKTKQNTSRKVNYWERNIATVASQLALVVKNPPANAGDKRGGFDPWGREDALEEDMATQTTPVFLPGKLMDGGFLRVTAQSGTVAT